MGAVARKDIVQHIAHGGQDGDKPARGMYGQCPQETEKKSPSSTSGTGWAHTSGQAAAVQCMQVRKNQGHSTALLAAASACMCRPAGRWGQTPPVLPCSCSHPLQLGSTLTGTGSTHLSSLPVVAGFSICRGMGVQCVVWCVVCGCQRSGCGLRCAAQSPAHHQQPSWQHLLELYQQLTRMPTRWCSGFAQPIPLAKQKQAPLQAHRQLNTCERCITSHLPGCPRGGAPGWPECPAAR